LDSVLDEVITPESVHILNTRNAACHIAYFELFPGFKPQFVATFAGKDDLIDTLRASCNIPFYFNGNVPYVSVRGGGGIDGFFTTDLLRFGCPPTGSTEREIIVCPYPASTIGLDPALSTCNYLLHPSPLQVMREGRKIVLNFFTTRLLSFIEGDMLRSDHARSLGPQSVAL
jgi:hypothetical protein